MSMLNERLVGNALLIEAHKRIKELEQRNAELAQSMEFIRDNAHKLSQAAIVSVAKAVLETNIGDTND